MTYQTTMTQKGQVTIPREFRDILRLRPFQKITVNLERRKRSITLKPAEDFLEVVKGIRPRKKTDVLKARTIFERRYERA